MFLISSLPGKALRTHVDIARKPSDSTCVLKAEPDKLDIKNANLVFYLSADLRKGSFGHFSSFCVIKFQNRLNFQDFACSYNRLKLLLLCSTIKGANSSDKIKRYV